MLVSELRASATWINALADINLTRIRSEDTAPRQVQGWIKPNSRKTPKGDARCLLLASAKPSGLLSRNNPEMRYIQLGLGNQCKLLIHAQDIAIQ